MAEYVQEVRKLDPSCVSLGPWAHYFRAHLYLCSDITTLWLTDPKQQLLVDMLVSTCQPMVKPFATDGYFKVRYGKAPLV